MGLRRIWKFTNQAIRFNIPAVWTLDGFGRSHPSNQFLELKLLLQVLYEQSKALYKMLTHSKQLFQNDRHFSYVNQPFRFQMVTAERLFFNELTFGIQADRKLPSITSAAQVRVTLFFSYWSIFKTYHG